MIKTAMAATLLAAAPALAQTTQPAQPAGPADTAVPAPAPAPTPEAQSPASPTGDTLAPASTSPTASGTETSQDTTAGDSETSTTSATETRTSGTAEPDQAAAAVEADWAKYDKNGNGSLNRAELNSWLTALQTAAGDKAPTRSYLSAAFLKADADKNRSVSKEELTAFLKS